MTEAPPHGDEPVRLGLAAAIAVLVAAVVLLVAVLPAEYGVDPTGLGGLTGFGRLYQDAPDAAIDSEAPPYETLYTARAEWRLLRYPLAERSGTSTGAYDTENVRIPVQLANITRVEARLDWTDDDTAALSAPDRFDLRIIGPDGRSSGYTSGENEEGASGNITTSLAWTRVPYPTTEDGIHFPNSTTDTSANGNWTVEVRLLSAGDAPDETDPGNDWVLTVWAEAYEMRWNVTEGGAFDHVTLTLPRGAAVEYKFAMQAGARLDYRWDASAPLYWDLHGEPSADPDTSHSHHEGTSDGEEGGLVTPFAGTHGWFWHNQGTSPVTIRLETSGDYRIIGVV